MPSYLDKKACDGYTAAGVLGVGDSDQPMIDDRAANDVTIDSHADLLSSVRARDRSNERRRDGRALGV
jgi:hypothetical protein